MARDPFYRELVPSPAPYKRTESDYSYVIHGERAERPYDYTISGVRPGMQKPALVSSYQGTIDQILFSFPTWAAQDPQFSNGYKSVLAALRKGTKFIIVHHQSARATIEKWFSDIGHDKSNIAFVPMPDYVSLTDWAEDAYVGAYDGVNGTKYLLEPWHFLRGGDALIADAVEDHTDIRASQCPLVFQGGNCLIGDDFWLLGRDYFHDSVRLLENGRAPVDTRGMTSEEVAAQTIKLFSNYLDATRKLILIGPTKPIPIQQYVGVKSSGEFFLDIVGDGSGTYQPIFHIDMFITLVGRNRSGSFTVLVGSPSLGTKMTGETSPQSLDHVYDEIAKELKAAGFDVVRNPLVHKGVETGKVVTLADLKASSKQSGGEILLGAIAKLQAEGAKDTSRIKVREYHHITWNNCLVENATASRNVYLPTFGHNANKNLAAIDKFMKDLWEGELGFNAHMLGDFDAFAKRQGVVHCIKKYIHRGP